jgi:hypothetical protein
VRASHASITNGCYSVNIRNNIYYSFFLDFVFLRKAINVKSYIAIITAVLLLLSGIDSFAQKVFSVNYESQANVKVFVVKYESQADLKVFKVKYESQAGDNNGKWFFTNYESQAKKKIFFVNYESQADVKIFFVDYESQAGWRNNSKKHFFY